MSMVRPRRADVEIIRMLARSLRRSQTQVIRSAIDAYLASLGDETLCVEAARLRDAHDRTPGGEDVDVDSLVVQFFASKGYRALPAETGLPVDFVVKGRAGPILVEVKTRSHGTIRYGAALDQLSRVMASAAAESGILIVPRLPDRYWQGAATALGVTIMTLDQLRQVEEGD